MDCIDNQIRARVIWLPHDGVYSFQREALSRFHAELGLGVLGTGGLSLRRCCLLGAVVAGQQASGQQATA